MFNLVVLVVLTTLSLGSQSKSPTTISYVPTDTSKNAYLTVGPDTLQLPVILSVLPEELTAAYLVEVGVGTPSQVQRVQIDTGSGLLWFTSSDPKCIVYPSPPEGFTYETTKNMSCSPSGINFNSSASSTFQKFGPYYYNPGYGTDSNCNMSRELNPETIYPTGLFFDKNYRGCPFLGVNSTDVLVTEGYESLNVVFGLVQYMPPRQVGFIGKLGANGIFGIDRSSTFTTKADQPESFTFGMAPLDCRKGNQSRIMFNGADKKYYDSEQFITLTNPSEGDTFWNTLLKGVHAGNGELKLETNATAIFDSGTPTIALSKDLYMKLRSAERNLTQFEGDITFVFEAIDGGDVNVTFPISKLLVDGYDYVLNGGDNMNIFGDIFLQNLATHFNFKTGLVSIAPPGTYDC